MRSPATSLIAAIDLRGRYREPFANWEAATDAPPARLRGDLELLPAIAEAGLARAAKDISQGGIVGTAVMLAECSGVGIDHRPARAFRARTACRSSAGCRHFRASAICSRFRHSMSPSRARAFRGARYRGGADRSGHRGQPGRRSPMAGANEVVWDFARSPLIGFRTAAARARMSAPALRIAILTHSTNPRGGVVHALALG